MFSHVSVHPSICLSTRGLPQPGPAQGGCPTLGTPLSDLARGVPLLGGPPQVPPHQTWPGGYPPSDLGYPPPPLRQTWPGNRWEYLIRRRRCASCVHAGLSCVNCKNKRAVRYLPVYTLANMTDEYFSCRKNLTFVVLKIEIDLVEKHNVNYASK